MKTVSTVALATAAAILGTWSILFDHQLLYGFTFALMLSIALILWKSRQPWWMPTLFFGLLGAGHLVAILWLRSQGQWRLSPASPALETFGPGYLLMAAFFFARERWFSKAHS